MTAVLPQTEAVSAAVAAIAAGGLAVVVDDADRENEGDLIGAASLITDEAWLSWCATPPGSSARR